MCLHCLLPCCCEWWPSWILSGKKWCKTRGSLVPISFYLLYGILFQDVKLASQQVGFRFHPKCKKLYRLKNIAGDQQVKCTAIYKPVKGNKLPWTERNKLLETNKQTSLLESKRQQEASLLNQKHKATKEAQKHQNNSLKQHIAGRPRIGTDKGNLTI